MGIYLAIMGEVFDVSAGQRHYGRGLCSVETNKSPFGIAHDDSTAHFVPWHNFQGQEEVIASLPGATPREPLPQVGVGTYTIVLTC